MYLQDKKKFQYFIIFDNINKQNPTIVRIKTRSNREVYKNNDWYTFYYYFSEIRHRLNYLCGWCSILMLWLIVFRTKLVTIRIGSDFWQLKVAILRRKSARGDPLQISDERCQSVLETFDAIYRPFRSITSRIKLLIHLVLTTRFISKIISLANFSYELWHCDYPNFTVPTRRLFDVKALKAKKKFY